MVAPVMTDAPGGLVGCREFRVPGRVTNTVILMESQDVGVPPAMKLESPEEAARWLAEVLGGSSALRAGESLSLRRVGDVWLATPPRDLLGAASYLVADDRSLVRAIYTVHPTPAESEILDGSWRTSDQLGTVYPRPASPTSAETGAGRPPVEFTQEELDWLAFIQSGKWQEQGVEPPPMPESLSRKLDP